ncbi:MAG: ABC transporter ATP-binding protein [Candidatus Methanomethylophilaceae archaeon]|nr:ABC transporter ATP-binding protein [Candidatus Methanomethylophilaceae archaeon]
MSCILKVTDVCVHLATENGSVRAVDNASFSIGEHETFALIGESGSGKSILGLAVMRLLPDNAVFSGDISLAGTSLTVLSEKEMQKIRGKTIGSIFQNPYLSMNPGIRVGDQIAEPMWTHLEMTKEAAREKAVSLLERFSIVPGKTRGREYPFQYSGGMLQRAMVAMGTAANPQLIIADEPTKGVDSLKKQEIAETFRRVAAEGCAFLLITHDIDFAKAMANRIAVNYCGEILEIAPTEMFFEEPLHPYSAALLDSLPERGMHPIPGPSPSMIEVPDGCRFHPRCSFADNRCRTEKPPMTETNGRSVRCWKYA